MNGADYRDTYSDTAGAGQFIGINCRQQPVGQKRLLSGIVISATDRPTSIGVQIAESGLVDITNCTIGGGTNSVYLRNSSGVSIRDSILVAQFYFQNNNNCFIDGNRIDNGIDYSNTSKTLSNNWGVNSPGTHESTATRGRLLISMPANATSGTVSIPNPIANAKYAIVQQHLDPIDKSDVISLSGNTITLTRAAPSTAFQIDAIVEYSIVY